MIVTKPFSKLLHELNDRPAKDAAYKFLLKWYTSDLHPFEQPNEYGRYDFVMYKGDDEVKVEVQHKIGWTDKNRWQRNFPTIDIEFRKHRSDADIFCILNNSFDTIAVIRRENVMMADVRYKDTKYGREKFFMIEPYKAYISSI